MDIEPFNFPAPVSMLDENKEYEWEGVLISKKLALWRLQDIDYCQDAYAAAAGAHMLLIITEWNEFRALDLTRIKEQMLAYNIVDLRDIYNPQEVRALGFTYSSVGRP